MNTLLVVLAFAVLAVLVYKFWKPYIAPPKRVVPSDKAYLYFFYTNWCGFSQRAMPEWTRLEEELEQTPYFGRTRVVPARIDADKERAMATMYGVSGYPTILLETSEGIATYEGRRSAKDLKQFLMSSLGKPSASL